MPKYMADVVDSLNWQVEFEAPDGLSDDELAAAALQAWADAAGARVTFRYDTQKVTTVLRLPE